MVRAPLFHLSCYTTLGLAIVCLGFAEMFFLGWMPWFLLAVAMLVGLAWKCEGQWQLSEPAANSVGLVIAFGMLGWIVFQLPRNDEELLAAGVPWPAGLLPHLGPLLMILTAVKLFRPKKAPDFWVLQLLGVMMVTLASVLAGEADHGIWVFLYLVSLVWCLAHFYRMSSAWAGLGVEARRQAPLFVLEPGPTRPGKAPAGFGAALVWSVVIAGLGAGLFVFVPRHASVQWVPHKLTVAAAGRAWINLAAGMDLNRTGKIELSDEVAFEVRTRNVDQAAQLPSSLYWRGETLDFYQKGRWYAGSQSSELWLEMSRELWLRILSSSDPHPMRSPSLRPASVPADKTYLSIRVLPAMAGNLVAAEPVNIDDGIGRFPYVNDVPARTGLFGHLEGTDTLTPVKRARAAYSYGQIFDSSASALSQKARRLTSRYLESILLQTPPEELVRWSRNLLLRQSGLTEAERTVDDRNRIAPAHHGRVARALAAHFADSGEYLYSLNIRRIDTTKDPNVDFLLNVKEGHCERYASGLALTLRALGIPCRIVHGFRGWEKTEDDLLVVRFNQAHSWVQALAPRADGDGNDWILLDPTPSIEAPLDRWQAFVEWVGNSVRTVRSAFRNGVLEYGSEQQFARLRAWWASLRSFGERGGVMVGVFLGMAAGAGLAWRLGRSRIVGWWHAYRLSQAQRNQLPWLAEALAIIKDKTGMVPTPSQTLLEFAAVLRSESAATMCDAFETLARRANSVRFGQRGLTDGDRNEITRNLGQMRS
jgi:transglutaminase-like putative cysteine protease